MEVRNETAWKEFGDVSLGIDGGPGTAGADWWTQHYAARPVDRNSENGFIECRRSLCI